MGNIAIWKHTSNSHKDWQPMWWQLKRTLSPLKVRTNQHSLTKDGKNGSIFSITRHWQRLVLCDVLFGTYWEKTCLGLNKLEHEEVTLNLKSHENEDFWAYERIFKNKLKSPFMTKATGLSHHVFWLWQKGLLAPSSEQKLYYKSEERADKSNVEWQSTA